MSEKFIPIGNDKYIPYDSENSYHRMIDNLQQQLSQSQAEVDSIADNYELLDKDFTSVVKERDELKYILNTCRTMLMTMTQQ